MCFSFVVRPSPLHNLTLHFAARRRRRRAQMRNWLLTTLAGLTKESIALLLQSFVGLKLNLVFIDIGASSPSSASPSRCFLRAERTSKINLIVLLTFHFIFETNSKQQTAHCKHATATSTLTIKMATTLADLCRRRPSVRPSKNVVSKDEADRERVNKCTIGDCQRKSWSGKNLTDVQKEAKLRQARLTLFLSILCI